MKQTPITPLPAICIVTPSFNQGPFIEETINSILSQGYSNLQYIVMDGGSTDETVEIIKRYEKYINHWESCQDRGQSHAINKGLKRARGHIFNWINSDDGLLPGALDAIAEAYQTHQFDVFLTQTKLIKGPQVIGLNGPSKKANTAIESALEIGLNQPGHFYKLEVVAALQGLDERYSYSMDLDLWIRYLLTFGQSRVFASETISSFFRFHEASKSEVEGWGEGSAFARERSEIYLRLSRQYKYKQVWKAFDQLFFDKNYPVSDFTMRTNIPEKNWRAWVNEMLFPRAQSAFYEEDFALSCGLSKALFMGDLPTEKKKDARAFYRHSRIKSSRVYNFFVGG
jgi:glycosyltransferase involved in cell wall biosynthesis